LSNSTNYLNWQDSSYKIGSVKEEECKCVRVTFTTSGQVTVILQIGGLQYNLEKVCLSLLGGVTQFK